jgi:hypothetical protein
MHLYTSAAKTKTYRRFFGTIFEEILRKTVFNAKTPGRSAAKPQPKERDSALFSAECGFVFVFSAHSSSLRESSFPPGIWFHRAIKGHRAQRGAEHAEFGLSRNHAVER